jgi:hypothetical protein
MLQSTKFEFKVKFSTQHKDVSVTIREGKNPIELNYASHHFKTGT